MDGDTLMNLETVVYETRDRIAYITMNRPEQHNALNHALMDDLMRAFGSAEKDGSVNVVVLKGNGRSFCSGYDLKGSYYITPPQGQSGWDLRGGTHALKDIEARYRRIWDFPKPTIAQVHGHCLAGGCYLQLLCDITVAADNAKLGHPAQRMGGVSSMPLWQVVLGVKKARYLLMTGRVVDGAEAERMGLVSLSVPGEQLEKTVTQIAKEVAEIPADGMLLSKEALNTDLEIMGLGALFRYHRQMNTVSRIVKGVTRTEVFTDKSTGER
jgi:enoyl-CoA hydratase